MMHEKLNIIEALLFAGGEPVSIGAVAKALDVTNAEAKKLLEELQALYDDEKRGLCIVKMENFYQLTTRADYFDYIKNFVTTNTTNSLSQAALETLSIIAYRQPITRGEIEEIRGVKSSSSIELLLDRGLICEAGRKETIGRPAFFTTTNEFLKLVQLRSIKELPNYDEFYDEVQNILEQQKKDAL